MHRLGGRTRLAHRLGAGPRPGLGSARARRAGLALRAGLIGRRLGVLVFGDITTRHGFPSSACFAATSVSVVSAVSVVSVVSVVSAASARSEERRVGKECRSRWSPY